MNLEWYDAVYSRYTHLNVHTLLGLQSTLINIQRRSLRFVRNRKD
jgi:hypothetical protein